jgi:hypothetical protein
MAEHSSPAETIETPESPRTPEPDVIASPSEAKGETKETLLEAVLKAVQPKDDEKTPADETSPSSEDSAPSPDTGQAGEQKGHDLSKDPSSEELAGYKKNTRDRILQLIDQRNSFRAEADVTRTLREFLVVNDIAREDFQLTLDLAAAMRRGDFRTFLEGVGPYVQLATQALGISLPPDLHQEVQAGRLPLHAAAQMSRDRYSRALAEQHSQRATQIVTSQQQGAAQANLAGSIERGVTEWENGIRQSDPDYGRKEETVKNFLWAVVQERGVPNSPEMAIAIAREAYDRANTTFRQLAPAPRATRAVPSSVNRSAPAGARPEPKSLMEAAMLGLERAGGGRVF